VVERGMRRLLLVSLLLAAAACGGASARPTSSGSTRLEIHLAAGDQHGAAVLTFEGQRQKGTEGSNCWTNAYVTRCGDTTPDVQAPDSFVTVPSGTKLVITGDAKKAEGLVATVIRHGPGQVELQVVQRLDLSNGSDVIDVTPGRYTLEIDGTWKQGTVPFYFGIRVVQPAAAMATA
jgi:hypothetical protein